MRIYQKHKFSADVAKERVEKAFRTDERVKDFKVGIWDIAENEVGIRARGIKSGRIHFFTFSVVIELKLKGWARRLFGPKIKAGLQEMLEDVLKNP